MSREKSRASPQKKIAASAHTGGDPHIGGSVERKKGRSRFRNGDEIHQLRVSQPPLPDHFFLNHGDHGIAAADGEQANLKKVINNCQKIIFSPPLRS